MNKYAWLLLVALSLNPVAVLSQEQSNSTPTPVPAPTATEKPAEAAAPAPASSSDSSLDPVLKQAKEQEGTIKYSHDAFSKGIMNLPGGSASIKGSMPSLSRTNNDLDLQNYGTYALMCLYEGNKENAISTIDTLDSKISNSPGATNITLAGNQYYFAIACYCNNDLENAEKYGLKTIDRYVGSGTKESMELMNLQQAYYLLAIIKDKQGKLQEAIEFAKKGAAIKPF